jgi:hypothetical protein
MSLDAISSGLAQITIEDRRYLAAKEAGRRYHYHPDYLGQLCRAKKVECIRIGRNWFVEIVSLEAFLNGPQPNGTSRMTIVEKPKGLFARVGHLFYRRNGPGDDADSSPPAGQS